MRADMHKYLQIILKSVIVFKELRKEFHTFILLYLTENPHLTILGFRKERKICPKPAFIFHSRENENGLALGPDPDERAMDGGWIFHACLPVLPDRAVPCGHDCHQYCRHGLRAELWWGTDRSVYPVNVRQQAYTRARQSPSKHFRIFGWSICPIGSVRLFGWRLTYLKKFGEHEVVVFTDGINFDEE